MDSERELAALTLTSPFVDDGLFRKLLGVSKMDANAANIYCKIPPAQRVNVSVLFDRIFYLEQNADARGDDVDALMHFVMIGIRRQQSPHPLIDFDHIREQVPEVLRPHPTIASLWEVLCDDRADPSPYFNRVYYRNQLKDRTPAGGLLKHFLEQGLEAGLEPNRLLNPVWYCNQLPGCRDVMSGLRHFVSQGDKDGRPPSPEFDSQHYLRSNPDVAAARVPALRHYITRGQQEGRSYAPLVLPSLGDTIRHTDARNSIGSIPVEVLMTDETIWRDARTLNYVLGNEAWSRLDEIERDARANGDHAREWKTQMTKEALRLLPLLWTHKLTDPGLVLYLSTRGYGPSGG
jgi:hypothetical protein